MAIKPEQELLILLFLFELNEIPFDMNYLNPEIKLEKELAAQIYDALQGDVVKSRTGWASASR